MLAGKTGGGMDERGLQTQGKCKEMGRGFLAVLKLEKGMSRAFAAAEPV